MPKAAQVLAALKRDGWVQIRQRGSHRRLVKGPLKRTWAFHDGMDLGYGADDASRKAIRLYIGSTA
jgi:predicted RNA binding protein YcfA (HicA-like mRNA interferase family)